MILSDPVALGVDIETYSGKDIRNGAYAYSGSSDFRILLIGYKFSDEDEVKQIDCTNCPNDHEHDRFYDALTDPDIIKTAYNANFERTCLAKYFEDKMPPEQWRCTMILAAQIGLPMSLASVGEAMGLPEEQQKLKTGRALIQYFCKPCKPTRANGGRTQNRPIDAPEKWELFKEYNRQDVVTEQEILRRLKAFRPVKQEEDLWDVDQGINDYGVKLDTDLAHRIVEYDAVRGQELLEESERITGLRNPNSLSQLKGWLRDMGIDRETLTKADVEDMLADKTLDPDIRTVLENRQSLGKTSVKKYQTMLDIAGEDDRARGIMQFYGGHTGRWAGTALQPQNLARNTMPDAELDDARDMIKTGHITDIGMVYGDPSDVFSQLVRTGFIPSEGNRFVVSDFSAIEARVIAWMAGEEWRLEVFRDGGDIYCESASHIYHKPVVKHGINGELRQRGKVAELALGYGGGVGAMKRMDTTGSVPEDEMQGIVTQWRSESPTIVRMWRECQNAACAVIEGTQTRRMIRSLQGIIFSIHLVNDTPVMFIQLPSGRAIAYWDPKVEEGDMGPRISYMTQNQTTRKWERTETYGGKLTENIIQSVARDCLAEKMTALTDMGYKIVFHVHDEMILDVPRSDQKAAEIVDRVMSEPIDWAPGLPLKGGTYECDFYRQD